MARGISPGAAEGRGPEAVRESGELRAELGADRSGAAMKERRVSWFEDLSRTSVRAAGFRPAARIASVIVLTLGLGIGANAVMFGLVDRLLLRPPRPCGDAAGISRFQLTESEGNLGRSWTNESMAWLTYPTSATTPPISPRSRRTSPSARCRWGAGHEAAKVPVTLATPSFFRLLGVRPLLGPVLSDEGGSARAGPAGGGGELRLRQPWLRRAGPGHRQDAVSREPELHRDRRGSQGFPRCGPQRRGRLDPFHAGARDVVGKSGEFRKTYNWQWLDVLARLKPGVSRVRASDEATRIQRAAVEKVPDVDHNAVAGWFRCRDSSGRPCPTRASGWPSGSRASP